MKVIRYDDPNPHGGPTSRLKVEPTTREETLAAWGNPSWWRGRMMRPGLLAFAMIFGAAFGVLVAFVMRAAAVGICAL